MSEFCITCPATGTRVSTGVKVVAELLIEPFANAAALMSCSACGKAHVWTPRGAIVDEDRSTPPETAEALIKPTDRQLPNKRKRKSRKDEKPIEIIE